MTTHEQLMAEYRARKNSTIDEVLKEVAMVTAFCPDKQKATIEATIKALEKRKWIFEEDVPDVYCPSNCPNEDNHSSEDHEPMHNEGYD